MIAERTSPEITSAASDDTGSQTAIVVGSSDSDRHFAGMIVERVTDLKVTCVADGNEALAAAAEEPPALVLTDGNEAGLVEALRVNHPSVPVILLTADGDEGAAAEGLRDGAANFVSKRHLRQELPPVLAQVLAAARTDRRRYELLTCLTHVDCEFVLDNDPTLVPVLVAHLQEHAERIGLVNKNRRIRLGVALEETLLNALYHGNLEVSSDLKTGGADEEFYRVALRRRREEPYRSRRLRVDVHISAERGTFAVRDEGPGFDITQVPDPTDPENLLRPSGRGLLLIRMFMDEAVHNAAGNELTLTMRNQPAVTSA
jgi:CheY-like chemotaxis protein